MNKKYIIIIGSIITILMAIGTFSYYTKTHTIKNSIKAPSGDLILKNTNKGNIKIVEDLNGQEIKIDLNGPSGELNNLYFSSIDKQTYEFSLPDSSTGITGTITVPKKIKIVDLDKPFSSSSGSSNTTTTSSSTSNSSSSDSTTGATTTPPVTPPPTTTPPVTPTATPINNIKTCGNFIIETGETCDDGNIIDGDGCSSNCSTEITSYSECTILIQQEYRNICCQQVNINTPHNSCTGYWLFDYNTRLCKWHCPVIDCGTLATPTEQNQCCTTQKVNEDTPPCSGDWQYSTTNKTCEYTCNNFNEDNDTPPNPTEAQTVASYCKNTYVDSSNQNKCCNDFLKHPLSIGAKPGYPDCIGKWSLQGNTCAFQCVTHEEMIEILKELKKNKVSE